MTALFGAEEAHALASKRLGGLSPKDREAIIIEAICKKIGHDQGR